MGKRGPKPGTGGRPKKALANKIENGNPGKRTLTLLDKNSFKAPGGEGFPKPADFLKAKQRDGELIAEELYQATYDWLRKCDCDTFVNPHLVEQYALARARWIQCEEMVSKFGFCSKHPTTGAPIVSPFVNIANIYFSQYTKIWADINQIVKENCTKKYEEDSMEALLS